MPAPIFFGWNAVVRFEPSSPARKPCRWIRYERSGPSGIWKIFPGSRAGKATVPGFCVDWYRVMKKVPPPKLRFAAPHMPSGTGRRRRRF